MTGQNMEEQLIMTGDAASGFYFHGPFASVAHATTYARERGFGPYSICEIVAPVRAAYTFRIWIKGNRSAPLIELVEMHESRFAASRRLSDMWNIHAGHSDRFRGHLADDTGRVIETIG